MKPVNNTDQFFSGTALGGQDGQLGSPDEQYFQFNISSQSLLLLFRLLLPCLQQGLQTACHNPFGPLVAERGHRPIKDIFATAFGYFTRDTLIIYESLNCSDNRPNRRDILFWNFLCQIWTDQPSDHESWTYCVDRDEFATFSQPVGQRASKSDNLCHIINTPVPFFHITRTLTHAMLCRSVH